MRLSSKVKKWFDNRENLFCLFLFVLIVSNIVLCFTGPLSFMAKVTNVLLPLGCYCLIMTLSRNCGKMLWILFLFVFFGASRIVLLYLFGQSIVAVDMLLNLATTNSSEATELLDNLLLVLVTIVILYVPALILGMISIVRGRRLSVDFIRGQRKRTQGVFAIGFLPLGAAYLLDKKYEIATDLYPANVCYNVVLAIERNAQTLGYAETSEDFAFHVIATHPTEDRGIYVLVVGETSRALNWSLYSYDRKTNPKLSEIPNLTAFTNVLTQSNTTHKSVPMLVSAILTEDFDPVYHQKGIITASREAGLKTAFFSNQCYNNPFIDFFGKEAGHCDFIKGDSLTAGQNLSGDNLLALVKEELAKRSRKQFIVLYTYGSRFNCREHYPAGVTFFRPNSPANAEFEYRDNLISAYDNSTRYTGDLLARLIDLLQQQDAGAAMLYTSNHGEDIFDDDRHLFLHTSPVPSYCQLHIPFTVWTSDTYREKYSEHIAVLQQNRQKSAASNQVVFHSVLDLARVTTAYVNDSLSVTSPSYTEFPRFHLNDHNEPRACDDIGLRKEDFEMFRKTNIR